MRSFRRFLALACFLMGLNAVLAVDFEDLKEKQGKVYGSEKEKRYVIDAFFVEWESFPRQAPTHSSFHFFWLYNTADYPKYARGLSSFLFIYRRRVKSMKDRKQIIYSFLITRKRLMAFIPINSFHFTGRASKQMTHLIIRFFLFIIRRQM
jgi:hypothetical protein